LANVAPQLNRSTNLPLATLRRVSTPWPQSNTSNCSVAPAVVPVTVRTSPSASDPAVTYRPVPTSRSAIRSTASVPVTRPPSRCVIPSSGVTWYGIAPEYQSV
jgi:hypothetical protein